jgi:hypothetical protein
MNPKPGKESLRSSLKYSAILTNSKTPILGSDVATRGIRVYVAEPMAVPYQRTKSPKMALGASGSSIHVPRLRPTIPLYRGPSIFSQI